MGAVVEEAKHDAIIDNKFNVTLLAVAATMYLNGLGPRVSKGPGRC